MTEVTAGLSHAILSCRDLPRMLDFYVDELGFTVTDRGDLGDALGGGEVAFLALDPSAAHHNLGLLSGRDADSTESALNHLAFQLPDLSAWRKKVEAVERSSSATQVGHINHCISWSMYLCDPEGNRIEFFVLTPFYVPQPIFDKLDISLSNEEIIRTTEDAYRDRPGFKPMDDWKASWQTAAAQ